MDGVDNLFDPFWVEGCFGEFLFRNMSPAARAFSVISRLIVYCKLYPLPPSGYWPFAGGELSWCAVCDGVLALCRGSALVVLTFWRVSLKCISGDGIYPYFMER